jgi:hypothetical protein
VFSGTRKFGYVPSFLEERKLLCCHMKEHNMFLGPNVYADLCSYRYVTRLCFSISWFPDESYVFLGINICSFVFGRGTFAFL